MSGHCLPGRTRGVSRSTWYRHGCPGPAPRSASADALAVAAGALRRIAQGLPAYAHEPHDRADARTRHEAMRLLFSRGYVERVATGEPEATRGRGRGATGILRPRATAAGLEWLDTKPEH